MKKIIINAFGQDRPGIVSEVTKIINFFKGNIETSKMLQLESDFSLLILVHINENNIDNLFEKLKEIKNLKVTGKTTKANTNDKNYLFYDFSIKIADNEGIVFIFSKLFKKYKINIISMETYLKNAPITGSPIFLLDATLMIPKSIDIKKFNFELKETAEVESIEFNLKNN